MSNSRPARAVQRDNTRTQQAKADTLARRNARMLKAGAYAPRAFNTDTLTRELQEAI